MYSHAVRFGFALFVVLSAVDVVGAQSVTGQIEGWVVTEDGAPLPGVEVTTASSGYRARTIVTDARGYFRFLALPPGDYQIDANFIGRRPIRLENQHVHIASTTSVGRLVAQPQPIAVEGVTGLATRPLLDPAHTTIGAVISRETLERLPGERDYNTVAALLPHVSNSVYGDGLNFAGATGLENLSYIDGTPGGVSLPYNFIKEIEVRTGGYDAEFKGALGGVINVVTQSGTNDFRAQAFGYYAGNRLGPEPRQNIREKERGSYTLYDVGASVSGPLQRDRMWFFAAWNPSFETEDVPLFGFGNYTDKTIAHRFAGKLTWHPSQQTRLEFNALGDPSSRDAVSGPNWSFGRQLTAITSPDAMLSEVKGGSTTFSVRAAHFFTPRLLLEASADRTTQRLINRGRPGGSTEQFFIDEVSVPDEVVWSGGFAENTDGRNRRTSGRVHITAPRGAHNWKAGFEVLNNAAGGKSHLSVLKLIMADGTTPVYDDFTYDISGDPVVNRAIDFFLQDSWIISDSLRFNVGVRWGTERIYASDGTLAARIKNEWQPRLGLVYQPGADGRYKLSGSYGRFYQQVPLDAPVFLYTVGALWRDVYYLNDPRVDNSDGQVEDFFSERAPGVTDLRGLYYDEVAVGYERLFGKSTKAGARAIRRKLGMALEDAARYNFNFVWGNPGYGELSYLPRPERTYTALELTFEQSLAQRAHVFASYVLSRTHGNYPGFFASDFGYYGSNINSGFDQPDMIGTGLLPNDRPHVFKLSGWYRAERVPVTLGASFLWQSGTPLSEFGGTVMGRPWFGFATPRGTAGRTPSVRDLNLRAAYRLPTVAGIGSNSALLLDLFHVGSTRSPLLFEQQHYFGLDERGGQAFANPDYGEVTAWAAGMAGRIGLQINF